MSKSNGTKFDNGKPRMGLLPSGPLREIAAVLSFGASKYNDHNWRGGFKWSRLVDASLRHLTAWNEGQDKDEESGLSHLAHAACCLLFLLEHEAKKLGEDDRYKEPKEQPISTLVQEMHAAAPPLDPEFVKQAVEATRRGFLTNDMVNETIAANEARSLAKRSNPWERY